MMSCTYAIASDPPTIMNEMRCVYEIEMNHKPETRDVG